MNIHNAYVDLVMALITYLANIDDDLMRVSFVSLTKPGVTWEERIHEGSSVLGCPTYMSVGIVFLSLIWDDLAHCEWHHSLGKGLEL